MNFSPRHRVQTASGPWMGTGSSLPGGRVAGAWSWPLTSIWCRSQRMRGDIPSLLQYVFMMWLSTGTTLPLP